MAWRDWVKSHRPTSAKNPKKLASKINEDFGTQIDKARAIYTWIALNITYDVEHRRTSAFTYNSQNEKAAKQLTYNQKISTATLKKGKGVCEGYATLFWKLCQLTGLECEVIGGNAKTGIEDIGNKYKSHAWNAIRIGDEWHLLDVTWGAGKVDARSRVFYPNFSSIYFMTSPDLFFLNHFPDKSTWTLIKKTSLDFSKLPLYYESYLDSDIEIVQPQSVIIEMKADEEIEFKIKMANTSIPVAYRYEMDKYLTETDYRIENELITFRVSAPLKTDYLTIYLDSEAIVTYKIQMR